MKEESQKTFENTFN